jgi:hypothetical protein
MHVYAGQSPHLHQPHAHHFYKAAGVNTPQPQCRLVSPNNPSKCTHSHTQRHVHSAALSHLAGETSRALGTMQAVSCGVQKVMGPSGVYLHPMVTFHWGAKDRKRHIPITQPHSHSGTHILQQQYCSSLSPPSPPKPHTLSPIHLPIGVERKDRHIPSQYHICQRYGVHTYCSSNTALTNPRTQKDTRPCHHTCRNSKGTCTTSECCLDSRMLP